MRNCYRSFGPATAAARVRRARASRLTMHVHRRRRWSALVCLCILPLSSCFVRKRVVAPTGYRPSAPLLSATKDELIERVHRIADPLQSLDMKMEMSPSVGSLYVGEVKDYATLNGYILFKKPDSIRILGLDPVIGSTIFDMVSVAENFRIYIPSKNRFIVGRNDAPPTSKKQLENLRPVAFLTSLMIQPPDAKTDITVVEEDTNEHEAVYILLIIRRGTDEPWLVRTLRFDRHNLEMVRQKTFDSTGSVLSDTTYSSWKDYAGVSFPSEIDIKRPQDHYEVVLNVLNLKVNSPDVTAERFILNQPPGTELQELWMQ